MTDQTADQAAEISDADLIAHLKACRRNQSETLRGLWLALKAISDMPIPEQDNMLSANMRVVAKQALDRIRGDNQDQTTSLPDYRDILKRYVQAVIIKDHVIALRAADGLPQGPRLFVALLGLEDAAECIPPDRMMMQEWETLIHGK
jgi:hypothetical protein